MKKITVILLMLVLCHLQGMEITRNGKPVSDIAIPENAVTSVQFAAKEFRKFIKIVSGADLEIVKETDPRKFANRIFIGCGAAPADSSVFAWRIKADDNNLYLHGNDKEIYSTKLNLMRMLSEWRITSSGSLLAVYDFADQDLGIRFVRPGDSGISVPVKKTLAVKTVDREGKPRYQAVSMSFSNPIKAYGGWKDAAVAEKFTIDCRIWMMRNGMVSTYWYPDGGHSFVKYWGLYGKSHPEYFAKYIDGTRGPLPGNTNGRHTPMCISNSGLHNRLISEWRQKKSRWHEGLWNIISACDNDSPGLCTCEKCRSWDGPAFNPPADAPYWGDKKIPHASRRFTVMGIYQGEPDINVSLTDRYCRFYLEILKRASKYNPNVQVYGYAYANYTFPPQEVKLNDRILIGYAGTPIFPMEKHRMERRKQIWEGWAKTGCRLEYRPNSTWAHGCMPLQYTRQLCSEYRMVLNTPALQRVFFDALRCEFSTQGLMYYTIARLTRHPEMTLEAIADEFFSDFGKAAPQIRKYYDYWQKISDAVTFADVKEWESVSGLQLNIFTAADFCTYFIKPEYFTESAEILDAAAAAADTERAKAEVEFVKLGLRHAQLTNKMHRARLTSINAPSPENKAEYDKCMKELTAFRNANEGAYISDMGKLCFYERYGARKSVPVKKGSAYLAGEK